jgi:predicted transposase/invertase (TIGR01784 family)
MPKTTAGKASFKHPKFAPLTLDFTFKKAFANERCTELLLFLLNAFLAEKLKCPIKDVMIMKNELLGKTRRNRGSAFDVFCEDASGARFIVEIQVGKQEHFIRRTFFYLCMAVANLAKKGKSYDFNLPKLYSISFLEFELDFGKGCTEVVQHLSMRNDRHPEVSYDMLQMTFVMLPRFGKSESECKTVMDKILFSLKNGHKLKCVPKSFREKELKDIFEIARISNFTSVELAKYEAAMIHQYDYKASMDYAKKEGFEEGLRVAKSRNDYKAGMDYAKEEGVAIGEAKGLERAARNMLGEGLEPALVARCTKLPLKTVKALR